MFQPLLFCRLEGTARGDVFPELGLTGIGSRAAEVADSTDADETSSTVASKHPGPSSLPLRFLLVEASAPAVCGDEVEGEVHLHGGQPWRSHCSRLSCYPVATSQSPKAYPLSWAASSPERVAVDAFTSSLTSFKAELDLLSTADMEDLLRAVFLYLDPSVEAAGSYNSVSSHPPDDRWVCARSVADILLTLFTR